MRHSAPIGFNFLTGSKLPSGLRAGAIVAANGSFMRQPPRQPALWWLPWNSANRSLGAPRLSADGWQAADGTRWGRPVGGVPGPDGALYVSDDQAGLIYRLAPAVTSSRL